MAEIIAEPLVSFVVESVGNFIIQEAKSLAGVRGEVERLQTELRRMRCFLKDANARREEGDETVRNWIAEISVLSYDTEDAIATFVAKVAVRKHSVSKRYLGVFKECVARREVVLQIKAIETKITSLTRSLQTYGIQSTPVAEGSSSSRFERLQQRRRSYPHIVEENVVGLEENVETVVSHLVKERSKVVSIWGMGGLGKTTLAKKVYNHTDIARHFDCRAWAYISQQCKPRQVLEEILFKLVSPSREEIGKWTFEELAEKLYQVQNENKCLVVLDDIWNTDAWDSLEPAFPNTTTVGSKILLTTRIRDVAPHVDPQCILYPLKHLTEEESWELFEKKISLGREEFTLHPEMMKVGKEMIYNCKGLPLAVVVLAGLLGTKPTLNEWEMVRRNIHYHLSKGKGDGGVTKVLELSYQDLPYQLKACFLYLSYIPEDHNVCPEKLVQMWMAEGIVSVGAQGEDILLGAEETMLDFGMTYLAELVQRSMVQVQLTRFSKRIKFCKLHDLMRDLCLLKSQEENFFKIVRLKTNDKLVWGDSALSSFSSSSLATTTLTRTRRLALNYFGDCDIGTRRLALNYFGDCDIGSSIRREIMSRQHIRSCLIHSLAREPSYLLQIESIFKSFKLVKVLDLQNVWYYQREMLPRAIGNLIHLRYFGITGARIDGLPYSIGNWRFLQTLDLRVSCYRLTFPDDLLQTLDLQLTSSYWLTIPNVIWKLERLRHLYLPLSCKVTDNTKGKLRLDGLSKLETLEGFDSEYCDVKCFPALKNLRKVSLFRVKSKDLIVILKSPIFSNSYSHMQKLNIILEGDFQLQKEQELLKQLLECHHLHKLYLYGAVQKLPDQFPMKLTDLRLRGSELEEDPMPTLEKLPNLRRLYLGVSSYIGKKMVCSAPHIPTTTTAAPVSNSGSGGGFPQLKILGLYCLRNLEEWKVVEGAMPSLFSLEIGYCGKLMEIPDGLRFITTLRELVIMSPTFEFRERLRQGGPDFYKIEHVPSIIIY